MTEILERLAAANPVPECDPPPIEDVWRKLSEPEPAAAPRKAARRPSRFGSTRRVLPGVVAIAVSIAVVIAIVTPLLGTRRERSRPVSPSGGPRAGATLVPTAQALAARLLAGRPGAIAAIDPRTGAIKVLYGNPSPGSTAGTAASPVDAAAEAAYPPAGAFDVVSAAAALDSGDYTPGSRIAGGSPLIVSGTPLRNEGDVSFGRITLAHALEESVNTVFAQVGAKLGRQTLATYMKRFGFYASLLPATTSTRSATSGVRIGGRLALPTDPRVDLGRLAIGGSGLSATPLQMAAVAAAIANGGELMTPHLTGTRPTLAARVMTPASATTLAEMMSTVVSHGTATAVQLRGVRVAGKTGTAQLAGGRSDAWFIGFAPVDHPTIAIAVVLAGVRGGFGGTDAAPIARQMVRALLAPR